MNSPSTSLKGKAVVTPQGIAQVVSDVGRQVIVRPVGGPIRFQSWDKTQIKEVE
jgi:hypothetical protein